MAPSVKKKKFSSDNRRHICENKPQSLGSFVTSIGKRRSVRVATKMNRTLRKIWICNYVWLDILPSFDHAQLGLQMALLSYRFNALVDAHFDGKTEFTLWKTIKIRKQIGVPKSVLTNYADSVHFPLADHPPLPSKIRFKDLRISYIDHSVIAFLRSNQEIFDRTGTNFSLWIPFSHENYTQRIWKVFMREMWPIFAPNIRHLRISADHLINLRRLISPTILTDLKQLNTIDSGHLYPALIADDGPNATAGQALSKWLHTPRKDGQPKRLYCIDCDYTWMSVNGWVVKFKEAFLRATTSVNYKIRLQLYKSTKLKPFESVNERTKEQMTLVKVGERGKANVVWLLERCKIGGTAPTVQWEDENSNNLNNVHFTFYEASCIGRLSPPNADQQMNFKGRPKMSAGPSGRKIE